METPMPRRNQTQKNQKNKKNKKNKKNRKNVTGAIDTLLTEKRKFKPPVKFAR